jgi:hypothetical protein
MKHWFWLIALGFISACTPRTSPYDEGPLGPIDPIFHHPEGSQVPSQKIAPPQGTSTTERYSQGEAAGIQPLAPPRVTIPGQYPGETYGSAAGRTYAGQPLEPQSSSVFWQNYYAQKNVG